MQEHMTVNELKKKKKPYGLVQLIHKATADATKWATQRASQRVTNLGQGFQGLLHKRNNNFEEAKGLKGTCREN